MSRLTSRGALTVNFAQENSGRNVADEEPGDFPSLRLIRRYKISLFVCQRNSSAGGNVRRRFNSFGINSALRDCAAFTRLAYLASGDIPAAFIKVSASLNVNSAMSRKRANETGKGISDSLVAIYSANYERFPFVS